MSQLQRGDSENKLCWDPFTCDFLVFKGLTPMIDHQRSHIKPARCYFSGPAFIAPKAAAPEASFKKISGLGSLGISTLGYNDTMIQCECLCWILMHTAYVAQAHQTNHWITAIALRFGDTAGTVLEQRQYRPLSSEDPHKVGRPDEWPFQQSHWKGESRVDVQNL